MKKVFALMIVSVFAFGMAACGDDDDDSGGGSSFDNVAACQELQDELNALECVTVDFDLMCDSYEGLEACDYTEYYDCLADGVYTCEEGVLTTDMDKVTECTDVAANITC